MFFKDNTSGVRWMLVFLGNPGSKYTGTRHNVGFMTADVLEKRENIKINKLRFNALTASCVLGGEKVFLIKPQTFMNLSGNSVGPAASFYKIPPERVLVICDDISLPVGKLRIRSSGSSGGHNGLKSIISVLGTDAFPRIKIGVGTPERDENGNSVIDWVLGKFYGSDATAIAEACQKATDAAASYISEGVDKAMNKFN
ncbi:MAG: aminoacyl-tRNA hydrolase [Oscillospiraceae bacterium]